MSTPTQAPLEQRTRLATAPAKSDFEKLIEKDSRGVFYKPFGEDDEIKLTVPIVQQLLCERTKSGKVCSDQDANKFIVMCRAMRLNPFEKDAFIAGYDTKQFDGGYAPKFSQIVAHQAYLKRAEASPHYQGMESGIILLTEDGKTIERETDFVLPDETKLVVGGWARVHRDDRKIPIYRRCTVANKKPKYESSFWSEDKTPEMICKCAEADALRSAFPTLLGGLASVSGDIDVTERFVQPSANGCNASSLVETISAPQRETQPAKSSPEPESEIEKGSDLGPQKAPEPVNDSPQSKLESLVISHGYTFDDFRAACVKEEWVKNADSLAGFDDLLEKDATRLYRADKGLLATLAAVKEGK